MCVPLMSMCCVKGRTCVSWCRFCTGVDFVHTVAILSAVSCVVCNFCKCVCAMSGAQAVCEDGSYVPFECRVWCTVVYECRGTESKALLMSIAAMSVLGAGLGGVKAFKCWWGEWNVWVWSHVVKERGECEELCCQEPVFRVFCKWCRVKRSLCKRLILWVACRASER